MTAAEAAAFLVRAVVLFAATNVDDVLLLALYVAQGARRPGTMRRIVAGQYLGFCGILGAAALAAWGARAVLPPDSVRWLGVFPLVLGLRAGWQAWRRRDQEDAHAAPVSAWAVAAVTFANGGDNIGVYAPLFAQAGAVGTAAYCAIFLALVAVLVVVARWAAHRRGVEAVLTGWAEILVPLVLVCLGVYLLTRT